jgi:hypothetical protein
MFRNLSFCESQMGARPPCRCERPVDLGASFRFQKRGSFCQNFVIIEARAKTAAPQKKVCSTEVQRSAVSSFNFPGPIRLFKTVE